MKITVSPLRKRSAFKVELTEGQRVEFKASAFFGASARNRQVEVIAQTIAAFMNSDGGDLYIGVDDDGYVSGIDSDLAALRDCKPETFVLGAELDDSQRDYRAGNHDKFSLKIGASVQGYLGKNASRLLMDIEFIQTEDWFSYARVPVKRADKGEIILFQRKGSKWTELWARTMGQKQMFSDRARDEFVARKAKDALPDYSEQIGEMMSLLKQQQKPIPDAQPETTPAPTADRGLEVPMKTEVPAKGEAAVTPLCDVVCRKYLSKGSGTTDVMDKFESIVDGKQRYSRLELSVSSCCKISILPYELDESTVDDDTMFYNRVSNVDFRVEVTELLIERKNKGERLIGPGFSFSDLKKSYTGGLEDSVVEALRLNSIKTLAKEDPHDLDEFELMLENPVEFRAHTSESLRERAITDPNKYKVVGIRFRKDELLFYCPDRISSTVYNRFGEYERDIRRAFIANLRANQQPGI